MKRRLEALLPPPGGMRRPVALLATGSVAAFVIGYAAKLVLLRLYSPADFGVFDFVIAIVGILIPVASLRYEDAIVLPEDDGEARHLLVLAGWLSAGFVLTTALLVPAGEMLLGRFELAEAMGWLWMVPVVLLVLRASKLGELWLTRRERFGRIAAGNVAQAGTMTAVRVAAGVADASPGGLLGGFAAGHAAAAGAFGIAAIRDLRNVPGRIEAATLRRMGSRYRRFALFSTPATLLSAAVTRLPFLLLLYYFSAEVVGWFGQAFNILYVPISLLAAAIGQVFFVRAAQAVRDGTLTELADRVHARLVLIAFFPVAVTAAAGEEVFSVLFGAPWSTAGLYASYLSAWIVFTSIGSQLTRLFDVLERQRTDLVLTVILLAGTLTALLVGGSAGDPLLTLLLIGVLGGLTRVGQVTTALRAARVPWPRILRPYAVQALAAAPAVILLRLVAEGGSAWVTTAVYAACMVAFAWVAGRHEGLLPDSLRPGASDPDRTS